MLRFIGFADMADSSERDGSESGRAENRQWIQDSDHHSPVLHVPSVVSLSGIGSVNDGPLADAFQNFLL